MKTEESKIPLLSGKSVEEMTPEEFKGHIVSLYWKPEAPKKEKAPFTFTINKKGNVVLRINRDPKWIHEEELIAIARETNTDVQLLYKKVEKKNSGIKLVTTDSTNQLALF